MNQKTINEAELDRKFRQALKEIFSGRFEDAEAKGKREGWKQGNYEGINDANERVAAEMLRDGMPLEKIIKYSRLDEEDIREIANSLDITVV